MKFSIDGFEQHIDETILKRGLSYFRNNCVEELEETAPGEYTAVVAGSEQYEVAPTLKKA